MLSEWDKKDEAWKKRYGFTFTYFAWWCNVAIMAIPLLIMLVLTIMGVDGFRPYRQNTGDKVRGRSPHIIINNVYIPQGQEITKDEYEQYK